MHWTREIREWAWSELHAAIHRGDIDAIDENTVCVDCGGLAAAYDHRSYFYPLKVEPVCQGCNNRRGPGSPPPEGEGKYSHGLGHSTGTCWNGLNPESTTEESFFGVDTQEAREDADRKDIVFSEGTPLHRRQQFGDLHGYVPNAIKHGDLRCEYFKKHDKYYISEDVV